MNRKALRRGSAWSLAVATWLGTTAHAEVMSVVQTESAAAGGSFAMRLVLSESTTPVVGYSLFIEIAGEVGSTGSVSANLDLTSFFDSQNLITAGGGTRDATFSQISLFDGGVFVTTNDENLDSFIAVEGVNDVLAEVVWDVSDDASGDFVVSLGSGSGLSDPFGFEVPFEFTPFVVTIESAIVPLPPPIGMAAIGLLGLLGVRALRRGRGGVLLMTAVAFPLFLTGTAARGQITEIIDETGDGAGNTLANTYGIATDSAGNVYVSGGSTDNVFKITPGGAITQIIDATGDGAGNTLAFTGDIAVDDSGNVYVLGNFSNNVFKITPGGAITQIIDDNTLSSPHGIAVDGSANVYVSDFVTDNVFKITPAGAITQIIDATGDGAGNTLDGPIGIAVDSLGNVHVAGSHTDNAFTITPGGVITQIIDSTGDGAGNALDSPERNSVAVDDSGHVYVAGSSSDNAFKIASDGTITQIIDSTGDGAGNVLVHPHGIAVDSAGSVYVVASVSNNAFQITTGRVITEIIDSTGDGAGNTLSFPWDVAADRASLVYVAGSITKNAFMIDTSVGPRAGHVTPQPNEMIVDNIGLSSVTIQFTEEVVMPADAVSITAASGCCEITEIIDSTGDGAGNTLIHPRPIAVDGSGNVYVAGASSNNAFKITVAGTITEIIDNLSQPEGIAVDNSGNVYVTGTGGHNAFKITPGGTITQIIDSTGDGSGNTLLNPYGIAVDNSGNVYVAGESSHNAFRITPDGTITQIIDNSGDGLGNTLSAPFAIAVDGYANVYLTGLGSDNAFKITPSGTITQIIDSTGDGSGNVLNNPERRSIAVDSSGNVYVAGTVSKNVFKITSGGTITEIIDNTGDDGVQDTLINARGVAVDASGNVYVVGSSSNNAFKITPGGTITQIIDSTGDGSGNILDIPIDLAVDGSGNVYVTGNDTGNAFKITPGSAITAFTTLYDNNTNELTVTLDEAIRDDRVTFTLADTITDLDGNPLDGEMGDPGDPTLPSGDGTPGGDAVFRFDILQGDVNRDEVVNVLDVVQLKLALGSRVGDPNYDALADLNSDGVVNVFDVVILLNGLGHSLPPLSDSSRSGDEALVGDRMRRPGRDTGDPTETIVIDGDLENIAPDSMFSIFFKLRRNTIPLVGYSLDADIVPGHDATGSITADVELTNLFEEQNLIAAGGAQLDPTFSVVRDSGEGGVFVTGVSEDLSTVVAMDDVNDVLAEAFLVASPDASGTFEIHLGPTTALSDGEGVAVPLGFSPATIFVGGVGCPADLDGSGFVDFGDVLPVLAAWGPCEGCREDLDGSGVVDFGDVLVVLAAWGACE